jgi:hypothetical protein
MASTSSASTQRLLHRDPGPGLLDLGLGEAGHEVALRHEARVDPERLLLAGVEVAAEQPESYGGLGAALGADHARRPRAGALAEGVALHEHDVAEPGLPQEPRGPGADRSSADDDGIGTARHSGHGCERGID